MGRLDPVTFEWIEDDAQLPVPAPVATPGSAPPPTFYAGGSSAPPPPPTTAASTTTATAAPPPLDDGPGGILPIPGAVSQRSTGSSRRTETPGLAAANAEQRSAGAAQVAAAEEEAKAKRLEAERKNVEAERKVLEQRVANKLADDALKAQDAIKEQGKQIREAAEGRYRDEAAKGTFWGEQSTPRKILWGIALALGGFGAAMTRQENAPLTLLTKAVEDWSDQRTKRLAALTKDLENARGWESNALKEHAELEIKLAPIKKAAAWEQVAEMMERELAATKTSTTAEQQAAGARVVAEAKANAAKERVAGEQFLAPEQREGAIEQAPGAPGKMLVTWRGKDFPVRGAPDEMRNKAASTESLVGLLGKYEALVKEHDPDFFTTGDGRTAVDQVRGEITAALKKAQELGALDNGVIRLAEMVVPDPTRFFQMFKGGNEGVLKGIQQARDAAIADMEQSLISQGNKPEDVRPALPKERKVGKKRYILNPDGKTYSEAE